MSFRDSFARWASALALALSILVYACGGSPTGPPPPPPPPPAPQRAEIISFKSTKNDLLVDSLMTFSDVSKYAEACTNMRTGLAVPVNGTFQDSVPKVGNLNFYRLNCVGKDGVLVYSDQVTIRGIAPVKATLTTTLTDDTLWVGTKLPLHRVCEGSTSAIISWSSSSLMIADDTLSLATAGDYTPTLTCTGEGGTATATLKKVAVNIPPAGQRVTRDRPDEVVGKQVQTIYAIPSDGVDRHYDTDGTIDYSSSLSQSWFASMTGKVEREDTFGGQGKHDIPFVVFPKTLAELEAMGAQEITWIKDYLASHGFNNPDKRYVLYFEGSSTQACGQSVLGGHVALLYLRAGGCGTYPLVAPGSFPELFWAALRKHEFGHLTGAVDIHAPDACVTSAFHMRIPQDMMYSCTGGNWDPKEVDAAGDNYYGDNVPLGRANMKLDPYLMPAPASIMAAARAQFSAALQDGPRKISLPSPGNDTVPPGSH